MLYLEHLVKILSKQSIGGTIPILELVVDLSIIFLALIASIFLLVGIIFITRLGKTLSPLVQRCLGIAENLESVSKMIREDVEQAHSSFTGLMNGLKDASSQIEKRIGEFTSLVDLVHREIESALHGLTGVLTFFSRTRRNKKTPSLNSSDSSEED